MFVHRVWYEAYYLSIYYVFHMLCCMLFEYVVCGFEYSFRISLKNVVYRLWYVIYKFKYSFGNRLSYLLNVIYRI